MSSYYVVVNVNDEYPIRSEPLISMDKARLALLEAKEKYPAYEVWIMEHQIGGVVKIHQNSGVLN